MAGSDEPGLPPFARQYIPRTRLPAGSLPETFIHPHGLFRFVLVTGPLSVIGVQSVAGREAIVVRAQHPRSAKVLVDRPDRSIDVGIARDSGFVVLLTERIGESRHSARRGHRARSRSHPLRLDLRAAGASGRTEGLLNAPRGARRCDWAGSDPRMIAYHDEEWGVPLHDERRLFELLCLESAQAGLSWSTILNRREGYREAYEGFDATKMAAYDDVRQARLMADRRIVRNRAKVRAFRDNARAVLELREETGGLDTYLWAYVGGEPIVNDFEAMDQIPDPDTAGGGGLG